MAKLQAIKSVFGTNATRYSRDGAVVKFAATATATYDATQPHGVAPLEVVTTAETASPAKSAPAASRPTTPVVGAIRWDAYFSQPGMPAYDDPNYGTSVRCEHYCHDHITTHTLAMRPCVHLLLCHAQSPRTCADKHVFPPNCLVPPPPPRKQIDL
jgi:hypothetical protein